MVTVIRTCIFLILLLIISPSFATEDSYQFDSIDQKNRFLHLTSELRCLVCQNQTIAESNASLANDMREKIYTDIKNKKTDKEIVDYLVSRYGNFVLYKPPFNAMTLGLWFGPLLMFILVFSYLIYFIRKKKG